MSLMDMHTVTVSVTGLEIVALKKLSLVSHALAKKIGGETGREQKVLADVLDELVRQIEIKSCVSA